MQKFVSDRSNWTRNIIHPRHSLLSHRRLCSDSPCQEPELVLLVFYGVARLTQDKIGLWYDHETHLFLYIVCTLSFSLFLTPASPPCITYVRLDPSTCWTLFRLSKFRIFRRILRLCVRGNCYWQERGGGTRDRAWRRHKFHAPLRLSRAGRAGILNFGRPRVIWLSDSSISGWSNLEEETRIREMNFSISGYGRPFPRKYPSLACLILTIFIRPTDLELCNLVSIGCFKGFLCF